MTQLALIVEIDGKQIAAAGADDWNLLSVNLFARRADPKLNRIEHTANISIGGLAQQREPGEHIHIRWGDHKLTVGSKVCVSIVETDDFDAPIKRYRSDATVQDSPYTAEEIRQMRYDDYLELRAEFEPNA